MAAFGGEDSDSLDAFQSRWERMIRDRSVRVRTVLWNGEIVGWVGQFELFQKPSVAYWIDREFWGRGIATRALLALLAESPVRPMYARVAKDNVASRRVLEKCGFKLSGEEKGFARYRGVEVEELIYQLRAPRGSPKRHPQRAPRSRAPPRSVRATVPHARGVRRGPRNVRSRSSARVEWERAEGARVALKDPDGSLRGPRVRPRAGRPPPTCWMPPGPQCGRNGNFTVVPFVRPRTPTAARASSRASPSPDSPKPTRPRSRTSPG